MSLVGYFCDSAWSYEAAAKAQIGQKNQLNRQYLADIIASRPEDFILPILVFTGCCHKADVRIISLAMIKSHSNWEDLTSPNFSTLTPS